MTHFIQPTVHFLTRSIYNFMRSVIDGPDPSAPYSWAGTIEDSDRFTDTKSQSGDGYESIC